MPAYRFVGSYTEIDQGRVKLERLGQSIELAEDVAGIVIAGGGAILPAARFDQLGFTEDELRRYAEPGPRMNAPEEFQTRLRAAQAAYCELRAGREGK